MERQQSSREIDAGYDNSARQGADPVIELHEIYRRLDALVARLTERSGGVASSSRAEIEPDMDVYENDREFLIQAAVPGVPPDKIRIEVTPHTLTLSAETMQSRSGDSDIPVGTKRHRRSVQAEHERYHFVYTLHAAVMPEASRAIFRHGIVDIHLRKAHTAPISVSVPVLLHEDMLDQISLGLDNALSCDALVITAREGSPRQKLGAAYVPNAGEDHIAKAQSTGERPAPGRAVTPSVDRLRTPENTEADTLHSSASEMGRKQ
jgi:HSP20 family molecular chaperone IbpA